MDGEPPAKRMRKEETSDFSAPVRPEAQPSSAAPGIGQTQPPIASPTAASEHCASFPGEQRKISLAVIAVPPAPLPTAAIALAQGASRELPRAQAALSLPVATELDEYLGDLADLFERFGRDKVFEIEARIKRVSPDEFAFIKKHLDRSPALKAFPIRHTTDISYGDIRATLEDGRPPIYMVKRRVAYFDMHLADGNEVRVSVSTEEIEPRAPSAYTFPEGVRLKTRHSYEYKDELLYELTQVRSGRDAADAAAAVPDHEVRVRFASDSHAECVCVCVCPREREREREREGQAVL